MSAPRASVVVLNYNGRDLLDSCLASLVQLDYDDVELVVVDNGSTDGSVLHVKTEWPGVRVVALPENVGVTAALNTMVQTSAGDYVALLNNDVELNSDWLRLLVAALEEHPTAAAAAGKLLQHQNRGVIDRAGDELLWSSACFGRGAGALDRGQYDLAGEVFSVGGAAALYRRKAFDQVGLFDTDFFAYLEDVDWGIRARLAGFVAWYEPRAVGVHHGGATLGDITPFSLYHLRRNQLWLVVKNYPAASLLRHGPAVLAFNLHALLLAVRKRQLGLVLRAYRDACRALPATLAKRRAIQRSRVVGSAGLDLVVGRGAPIR